MKKGFLLSAILLAAATLFAQVRPTTFTPSRTLSLPTTAERGIGDTVIIRNLGVEDTTFNIYSWQAPQWGFATGHNSYGDLGWAEKYNVVASDSTLDVIGVLGYFVGTVSASSTAFASFGVYDADGTSGAASAGGPTYAGVPGTQLTVVTKAYTDIDVSGAGLEFTPITPPVHVEHDFFMSFELEAYNPVGITDSLGLIVAVEGSRPADDTLKNGQPFCRNAVKWSDNVWYDEYYQNTNSLINYILFPVVIVQAGTVGVDAGLSRGNLTYQGNYPNPANTTSNMKFTLKDNTPVTINVYDMSGRLMFSQNEGEMLAGSHDVALNVANLAAGSYLVSITTNNAAIGGMFQVTK